jgi:hypothetical protein
MSQESLMEKLHMRMLAGIVAVVGSLGLVMGCGGKPCAPIPESATVKSLGILLGGGSLCKDEKNVATVEYPKEQAETISALHKDSLSKAGWTVEVPSEGVLLATRASNTLFIVTGKQSQDSKFPFAVVRYCQNEACRKSLSDLANAMKKP